MRNKTIRYLLLLLTVIGILVAFGFSKPNDSNIMFTIGIIVTLIGWTSTLFTSLYWILILRK